MIYILTGDVQTGKSFSLNQWSKDREDVVGLLSLVNKEGQRDFLNIRTQETFSMHAKIGQIDSEKIFVGKFEFSKKAFQNAIKTIEQEVTKKDYKFLVIDELGKLELKNQGLYSVTKPILSIFENDSERHLILVIRESLLYQIINHMAINVHKIRNKQDIQQL